MPPQRQAAGVCGKTGHYYSIHSARQTEAQRSNLALKPRSLARTVRPLLKASPQRQSLLVASRIGACWAKSLGFVHPPYNVANVIRQLKVSYRGRLLHQLVDRKGRAETNISLSGSARYLDNIFIERL